MTRSGNRTNHSSLFWQGSVDYWEISAGPQGPRTFLYKLSSFYYVPTHRLDPVSFFDFFLDNDAPYRAVRMMCGGTPHQQAPSITCQRHQVPVYTMWVFVHGTWLIPFPSPHPSRRRQGPGEKRGTFYRLLGGNSSSYIHMLIPPRPTCTVRRFVVLAAFLLPLLTLSGRVLFSSILDAGFLSLSR